jgi:cytoskeletal protein RodZ
MIASNIQTPMFRASSILKDARLDREIELTDISKKLKIPVKYLEALENEDIKNFPQEPYCSLIVKDYADFLGLHGNDILSLFRRDFEQKRKSKPHNVNLFSFTPKFTFTVSILAIIVMFSFYLLNEYIKFNRPPKLKINWPSESITLGNTLDITGITDSESTVKINQDLIIVDSKGNFQKKVNLMEGENRIVVESKSSSGKVTVEEKIIKSNQ